jgi:hypothetical protein
MEIAADLIKYELAQGYVLGPFTESPFPSYRISPISVAFGKYSNKPRLVVDLSAPHDSPDEVSHILFLFVTVGSQCIHSFFIETVNLHIGVIT